MNSEIYKKIINLLPKPLSIYTKDYINPSVVYLLEQAEENLDKNESDIAYINSKYVLEYIWEELNTGYWKDVSIHIRQIYTIASIIQILAILKKDSNNLLDALKITDKSLLLGAPLENFPSITEIATLLSTSLDEPTNNGPNPAKIAKIYCHNKNVAKITTVDFLVKPSLEYFYKNHFSLKIPAKLTECISHWDALEKWKDIKYIQKIAGNRTVPVEIGAKYTDDTWGQKLMTISEFIENHIWDKGDEQTVGYLAQHPLFEQVPELLKDIKIPDYCSLSELEDQDDDQEDVAINAWFGPGGTISPLHTDPKHNLLVQVVGEKKVTLYSPEDSENVYPHEDFLLENTAQIDPENPDFEKFPNFKNAKPFFCILSPGDILYIPPKWWHHVRSLSMSFSVSYWWK